MSKIFHKLFEPFKIGPYALKNRIIFSPMASKLSFTSGETSPQQLYHYAERARGGAAMIIVEGAEVGAAHVRRRPNLRADSDAFLAGLHELAETIHLNGAIACLQLIHVGMWGVDPVSPSGISCVRPGGRGYADSRAMSPEEIEEVIVLFSDAAYRAQLAEFDMVELHGATAYLLQQFVSPHTNRRQDEWGLSFDNRIRLPLEILRQIRQKCGPELPVGYRVVLDEMLPDGITFDDATAFVKRLEQEGVAYISPMRGTYETFHIGEGTMALRTPSAQIVKYTEPLKRKVSIPVFATFQIQEPEIMEAILEKNQADAIVLGRPLLADPEMPNKIKEDRVEDICMCIRCNHCNETSFRIQHRMTCTQNPATGRGRDYAIQPTLSRRKVLVIGGGPAGLEAARVAALRGHDVTLLEKETELGGQVKIAALPIGKDRMMPYVIGWRACQCDKAGVKIELGREATVEVVEEYDPEVVIIATGANPLVPQIRGAQGESVATAWDVLQKKAKVGRRVVIVGGGLVGVETADFLVEKGLAESVTIVEMLPQIAEDMDSLNGAYVMQKLAEYGVTAITNSIVQEITDRGVVISEKEGNEQSIEADTVVLALGAVCENKLAEALEGKVSEMYTIGDCRKPQNMTQAILEGAHVAQQI